VQGTWAALEVLLVCVVEVVQRGRGGAMVMSVACRVSCVFQVSCPALAVKPEPFVTHLQLSIIPRYIPT
jgi:hypothetical protein